MKLMTENNKLNLQHFISLGFICFILLFLFFSLPNNKWHFLAITEITFFHNAVIAFTVLVTILITVLPMSLSPYWNGTIPYKADKQQYDRMGDALLQGRLYIDNGDIDPALEVMENPYDSVLRENLGIHYHWDEAYYNHHYYMYFGIVPTLLLFIPYKLITGEALLSYQATQIFATISEVGIFYLFYILSKCFFKKIPFSLYLLLSSSFSVLSVGYSITAPALYCTAIVSAVCLMVWSIIFFFKSAWIENDRTINTKYLLAGSFLGALAFGCRPPVALANMLIFPVIVQICIKYHNDYISKIKHIIILLFPYLFIGSILMMYNYLRFDNVFEFGQSYQLTITDQHNYGSFADRFDLKELILGLFFMLYGINPVSEHFPFLFFNGAFINYPILLFSVRVLSIHVEDNLRKKGLYYIASVLLLLPFIISLIDVYWSPFVLERYRLDFYYLLCIASFIAIASWLEIDNVAKPMKKILIHSIIILAFAVFVVEFLFFCVPFDRSFTYYYPEVLNEIYKGLRFGF